MILVIRSMILVTRSKRLGHKSSTQPTAVLKIEGHCAEVVSARQLDHRRSVFSAAVRAR